MHIQNKVPFFQETKQMARKIHRLEDYSRKRSRICFEEGPLLGNLGSTYLGSVIQGLSVLVTS